MTTRRSPRRLLAVMLLLLLPLVACNGGKEDEDVVPLPSPVNPGAECADGVAVLPAASVALRCGTVSGALVAVDIVITDTPAGEEVVAAALDLALNPPVATFLGCTPGGALGSPSEVALLCSLANNNPAEILISAVRQSLGPGVAVAGSQILATLNFRLTGTGNSTLQFVNPNAVNGSALLRRDPGDPTAQQVIPGIIFPTGTTISNN